MNHRQPKLTGSLIASISIICLGSLQFGYHMAELNSPESIMSCHESKPDPSVAYDATWFGRHGFEKCIPMSPEQVGIVTSVFSIGGLIGSLYVGPITDTIGRKRASLLHCVIYFVGSTINGLSNSYFALSAGRFVAGLGAGAALVITSIFINEIAPSSYKGFLGSMNQVSVNVGILFTQMLALRWCTDNAWRLLLFMASALAIVDLVLVSLYIEESPMWLLSKGQHGKAAKALQQLRGGDYADARNEIESWGNGGEETQGLLDEDADQPTNAAVSLKSYVQSPEFNNSKIAATGILVFQQFCGINSIIFYGVSVLIKIFPTHAIFVNCMVSVVNMIVTFASAPFVDKLGRKPLLMMSSGVMGIATSIMAVAIITSNSFLSVLGTFTYIIFFAIGLGPIPFLIVGEVTQPQAKASAQSWGTAMNWVATFIVGFLFPVLKNSRLGGGVYFIFTAMCAVTFMFVKYYLPETKGKSTYEEVWRID